MMYVVTDIKIEEYDGYVARITCETNLDIEPNNQRVISNYENRIEEVHGKCFVMANGDGIMIGLSEKVSKVLGAPFEAIQNMQKDIAELRDENIKYCNENYNIGTERNFLNEKLNSIEDMTFMARLKFLFTKKINNIKK